MADNSVVQIIKDAEIDARSLSEFISKDANFTVTRRLAPSVHTLDYYIDKMSNATSQVGFVIKGTFASGATLNNLNDVAQASDGKLYRWGGALPKTVSSGSTPQNTGGFGATAWVEVSDASLRSNLAVQSGANLVGFAYDGVYNPGSIGERLSFKRISGVPLLGNLKTPEDSGTYLVSGVTDGAGFNGIAKATMYLSGGNLYGYCEVTSYGNYPPRRSIARCTQGVWSDWREVAMLDNTVTKDDVKGSGVALTSNSKVFPVAKGAYSWWNEPQSIQMGDIIRKTYVGAVDGVKGWAKSLIIDSSKNTVPVTSTYLASGETYIPDEHNAPVTLEARDTIVTFYPGHADEDYLPYRVALKTSPESYGKEMRVSGSFENLSYAQAFYDYGEASSQIGTLYVMFRASGANGLNRSWYLASSQDWDADEPVWDVNEVFTDTYQMYVRMVPSRGVGVIRFLLTRNATYDNINGIWFAYLNLANGDVKTAGGVTVGSLEGEAVAVESLVKIYDAPDRIRLFDAQSFNGKIPILLETFKAREDGYYRYVEFEIGGSWSILKDVPIVLSGKGIDNSSYYGGAHFSNLIPQKRGWETFPIGSIYTARSDSSGAWYLEEYTTSDGGSSWSLERLIDHSTTEKIFRPRVPFGTRQNPIEGQIILTWCKGTWTTYRDYDSTIWALRA